MSIKEIVSELTDWSGEMGLTPLSKDGLPDLNYVLSIGSKFDDLGFEEMDEAVDKVSSYCVYVASQKSSFESMLGLLKRKFDQRLHTATDKLIGGKKFRTYEERKAVAINMDHKLQAMSLKIAKLQAKFDRIRDLPRTIESRLVVLRKIYERRVNEDRFQN